MALQQPRVAVVGGGIAGTLCALVLKNRSVVRPTILDAGRSGLGGRLRHGGAQVFRAADPALASVCAMLEREGLLARWKGRFGVLGSAGGGFLPADVVTSSGLGGMRKHNSDDDQSDTSNVVAGRSTASDGGDFCHFADGSRVPTYVGVPNMEDLCPGITKLAGIDTLWNARVVDASPLRDGWKVNIQDGKGNINEERFDALVLATHDASLASRVVHSIVDAEVAASDYESVSAAIVNNESVVIKLTQMADALQIVRNEGRMPVYTLSVTYPSSSGSLEQGIPFDAVSVPGSHLVQFLARNASKPNHGNNDKMDGETWTAVSTSLFADRLLAESGLSDEDRVSEATKLLSNEVSQLLSPFCSGDTAAAPVEPLEASAKRWSAAFTSKSLGLKEDSIALAPWRLAVCGDFIREMSVHATPLEAAALSGLEAGERVSSLFFQGSPQEEDSSPPPPPPRQ